MSKVNNGSSANQNGSNIEEMRFTIVTNNVPTTPPLETSDQDPESPTSLSQYPHGTNRAILQRNLYTRSYSAPNTPRFHPTQPQSSTTLQDTRHNSLNENLLENTNFTKFKNSILLPAAKWAYTPITKMQKKSKCKPSEHDGYKIEYSIFQPPEGIGKLLTQEEISNHFRSTQDDSDYAQLPENYVTELDFEKLIKEVKDVIENDHVYPERIMTGSSGSYFVFGKIELGSSLYEKVGVFKPKSEEPYGPLSPKWTKWLHRTFFPCCFGRSCLIPNLGYISEAAASVLDCQLQSYIVPYTAVVRLRAPTFYYKFWDKSDDVTKLSYKIGSFQMFLHGYVNADLFFKMYPIPTDEHLLPKSSDVEVDIDEDVLGNKFQWSRDTMRQFREELEKMVILDYLMRNTDRGMDNWMIKLEWHVIHRSQDIKIMHPVLKIGAIDSGLAFPWKHPNEWRSFPFGWLFLPLSLIGQPFSKKTRQHYLPLLTSKLWWESTVVNLKQVFMKDNDFKERLWNKQLAVLKGQAFNVVETLKLDFAGPLELTRCQNLLVFDDLMYIPRQEPGARRRSFPLMYSSCYESDVQDGHRYLSQLGETPSEDLHEDENEHTPLLAPLNVNGSASSSQVISSPSQTGDSGPVPYESGYSRINSVHGEAPPEIGTKVVIERLVKEHSNPPVFTWC
ncbi:Type II phosphatidylinositol 4-kinase [Candida orthopsilosis Co 90-125]|uniref:Phosphatidylinositol 4-kinase n=1 Tax=Candida orthopsilosis (strain 90-125) TaxID=1136231 RepID=H8X1F6_CANO9|nr:Type II phosphatidylinositol 4-kinase [Candida orthopsilosis Co 90-125]CCG22196.1 Type II phosphatidylinositol 4-kinase [Candida orthopsilosis Co 90-125]